MSHASIIVALSPADLAEAAGDIKAAVAHQMKPFDENGAWFADGSRWDYWVIGGRASGKFLGADTITRAELSESALADFQEIKASETWEKFNNEPNDRQSDPFVRDYLYGLKDDETLESLIESSRNGILTAYAFLRDRQWHERERMGWFGGSASTECDRKSFESTGEEYSGRCINTCEKSGAKIITFGEDDSQSERWNRLYWPRFIRNLPPETTLVSVDYHV